MPDNIYVSIHHLKKLGNNTKYRCSLYCIRTNGKRGGGVSLYVKKSISYKVRTKLAFQTNDSESLVIEFVKIIFSSKKNIIVCIFYRSPNSSLKLFIEKLDNILDIIHREKCTVILLVILM